VDPAKLLLLIALLAASAYFSGAETSLFSLRPLQLERLRRRDPRAGQAVAALLERPRALLTTVLIGNNIVNILLSVIGAGFFVELFGHEDGPFLATLVLTLALLVFGEIVPKTIAVGEPEAGSRLVAPSLWSVHRVLRPLTRVVTSLTDRMGASLERRITPRQEALTEDEIKTLITMGSEYGVLGEREKEFIHNVFHLNDRVVGDILTPRSQVFALDATERIDAVRANVARAGFSRIPIYTDGPENVVGIVEVTDLLHDDGAPDPRRLADVAHDLHFYPDGKSVGSLLIEMRERGMHLAGVVDEHGSFAGIVTLEDAVEEVIGEVLDLHDRGRYAVTHGPAGEVTIAGQMELEVFNQLFDCSLEDEDVATIGGYMTKQLGRIPQTGDVLRTPDVVLVVERALPQRVVDVRVHDRKRAQRRGETP
jgi:putative hemolysin